MLCQSEVYARISAPRLSKYEAAAVARGGGFAEAWALYEWNVRVAGACMPLLQTAEVILRNSIALAFAATYGGRWLQEPAFQGSLKKASGDSLRRVLAFHGHDVNKSIPDLKFVFWEELLTTRHNGRVWAVHLSTSFPAHPPGWRVADVQQLVFRVRRFRNRVAHGEPLFQRSLAADVADVMRLVEVCSPVVARWVGASLDPAHIVPLAPPT